MRTIQLEAKVTELADHVLCGGRIEDDLIECKREWPEPEKARQLAGHANAARGEPIIWIVGLDEDAHELTELEEVDVDQWWASMAARFDERTPEMQHVWVTVRPEARVAALLFSTDDAPYVITKGAEEQGRFEREVPWRAGTRTRSARRHELLRLLAPTVAVPDVEVLDARVTARIEDVRLSIHAYVELFFVPMGSGTVVLPAHTMEADLELVDEDERPVVIRFETISFEPQASVRSFRRTFAGTIPTEPAPQGRLYVREGTIYLGEPGSISGRCLHRTIEKQFEPALRGSEAVRIRLRLPIAGSERGVRAQTTLSRQQPDPQPTAKSANVISTWKAVRGPSDEG